MAEFKYEQALAKLEKIVADLEDSEMSLEMRLKKFEEGTKLARQLVGKLDEAKKKVQVLVGSQSGEPIFEGFEDAEGEEEGDSEDGDEIEFE